MMMNDKHNNLLINISLYRKNVMVLAYVHTRRTCTQSVISPNCCWFADYLSDDMSTTAPELMVRRPVYQQDELNHLCKYVKPKRIRKCQDLFAWICARADRSLIFLSPRLPFTRTHVFLRETASPRDNLLGTLAATFYV